VSDDSFADGRQQPVCLEAQPGISKPIPAERKASFQRNRRNRYVPSISVLSVPGSFVTVSPWLALVSCAICSCVSSRALMKSSQNARNSPLSLFSALSTPSMASTAAGSGPGVSTDTPIAPSTTLHHKA
jgi:hypothetical protein